MSFRGIVGWLFTEAGAGWVFGIVSLIGLLFTLWSRKKPQHIVCREMRRMSLIKIRKSAREKISVSFGSEPVDNLAQLEVDISNQGSEVVQDVLLLLRVPGATRILDVSYDVTPESLVANTQSITGNQVKIAIPFLNPFRHHRHQVRVSIVCDGNIDKFEAIGAGAGWSVQCINLPTSRQLARTMGVLQLCLGVLGVLMLPYARWLDTRLGIAWYEITLRAVVAWFPWFFALAGVWALQNRVLSTGRRLGR